MFPIETVYSVGNNVGWDFILCMRICFDREGVEHVMLGYYWLILVYLSSPTQPYMSTENKSCII